MLLHDQFCAGVLFTIFNSLKSTFLIFLTNCFYVFKFSSVCSYKLTFNSLFLVTPTNIVHSPSLNFCSLQTYFFLDFLRNKTNFKTSKIVSRKFQINSSKFDGKINGKLFFCNVNPKFIDLCSFV